MDRAASLALALALAACAARADAAAPTLPPLERSPWFCHGLDCPRFRVVATTDAYETREYEAAVWATTTVDTYAYTLASPVGFKRLFAYISGANEEGVEVPMTAPVLVETAPSCGPFCKQSFNVSFYVPTQFQEDPPAPREGAVFIHRTEPFTAYVAQTGGFLVEDYSIARMAGALADALDAQGVEYEEGALGIAGYDPPFRLKERHNEVWLRAAAGAAAPRTAET
jgi:hypothetical protein